MSAKASGLTNGKKRLRAAFTNKLPAGKYSVSWRVKADDGEHTVAGEPALGASPVSLEVAAVAVLEVHERALHQHQRADAFTDLRVGGGWDVPGRAVGV